VLSVTIQVTLATLSADKEKKDKNSCCLSVLTFQNTKDSLNEFVFGFLWWSSSPGLPLPLSCAVSQTGQHSPSGITTFPQLDTSSHCTSSHKMAPLSQTQILHGSGFQMSLFVYTCPFSVQLNSSSTSKKKVKTILMSCFASHVLILKSLQFSLQEILMAMVYWI